MRRARSQALLEWLLVLGAVLALALVAGEALTRGATPWSAIGSTLEARVAAPLDASQPVPGPEAPVEPPLPALVNLGRSFAGED